MPIKELTQKPKYSKASNKLRQSQTKATPIKEEDIEEDIDDQPYRNTSVRAKGFESAGFSQPLN